MKNDAIKKAVGYCRVSTDEQSRNGLSMDGQEAKVRAFAESQGWKLTGMYPDPGYSGKDLNRPGLSRMVEDIKAGMVDVVLVYKVDRLTRKQKDLWHLLEDVFEPRGIGFKSITEPFDMTTPAGRAFLGMLSVFAQLERDQTRERIRDDQEIEIGKSGSKKGTGNGQQENGELQEIHRRICGEGFWQFPAKNRA